MDAAGGVHDHPVAAGAVAVEVDVHRDRLVDEAAVDELALGERVEDIAGRAAGGGGGWGAGGGRRHRHGLRDEGKVCRRPVDEGSMRGASGAGKKFFPGADAGAGVVDWPENGTRITRMRRIGADQSLDVPGRALADGIEDAVRSTDPDIVHLYDIFALPPHALQFDLGVDKASMRRARARFF